MKAEKEIKETIENLINAGTNFDIDKLEMIYHNNMQVIMIDGAGEKIISNKRAFKDLFQSKRDNHNDPLNTWAEFHHIEAQEQKGHVILSRKVNLTGTEQKIILNIDLVKESNQWQVIREVIIILTEI